MKPDLIDASLPAIPEENAEELYDQAPCGYVSTDPAGRIVRVNQTLLDWLGYTRDELVGNTRFSDILTPPGRIYYETHILPLLRMHGIAREISVDIVKKEGPPRPVLLSANQKTGQDGRSMMHRFTLFDISERRRYEQELMYGRRRAEQMATELTLVNQELRKANEELRKSEQRERAKTAELAALLDAVPVAMFISRDPECTHMIGNETTYDLLRLPPGENVSKLSKAATFRVLQSGRDLPLHELPLQRAASTGISVRNLELDILHQDGTRLNMVGNAVPLIGEDRRPCGAVGAFIDVTEMKRNEDRLRQAQKLESIGLLAGGIAHDFNNILTGVVGYVSLAADQVDPQVSLLLEKALSAAERAAMLTAQLLAYSGKGQFVEADINVPEAVEEIVGLVELSIPKTVRVTLTNTVQLPKVRMDPIQLHQIVMNLIINAGEAIGQGNPGNIFITTSSEQLQVPVPSAAGDQIQPGWYVVIEVADSGTGIDPGILAKIFDPFFTTKFTGRGLGLAAIGGILRTLKGGITVTSERGRGSKFMVYLPSEEPSIGIGAAEPDGKPAVLIVDDEPYIRTFLATVVQRLGGSVFMASNGEEALAVFAREQHRLTAVILDIVIPGMGADKILPAMKASRPDLRVLLTSGYSAFAARQLCTTFLHTCFIQKPYTAERIGAVLTELLA